MPASCQYFTQKTNTFVDLIYIKLYPETLLYYNIFTTLFFLANVENKQKVEEVKCCRTIAGRVWKAHCLSGFYSFVAIEINTFDLPSSNGII